MQSSHLSFQEYFTACALCEEGVNLSGSPPWQWPAWWANALRMGEEMGQPFQKGLIRAAGVEGTGVNLSKKLSGDRPTALRAILQLMSGLVSINLGNNRMVQSETLLIVNHAKKQDRITSLGLATAQTDYQVAVVIAEYLKTSKSLTYLNLAGDPFDELAHVGSSGGKLIAEALGGSILRTLNLSKNKLGGVGDAGAGDAFAAALKVNRTLTNLNLAESQMSYNHNLWVEALTANNILLKLDLSGGGIRDKNGLESAMRGGEHPRGEGAAIEVKC